MVGLAASADALRARGDLDQPQVARSNGTLLTRDCRAHRLAGWARCPVPVGECQAYLDYGEDDQYETGDVGEHDGTRCRCREADRGPPVSVGPDDQRPSGSGHG